MHTRLAKTGLTADEQSNTSNGVLIAPLEEPDGSQWLTQIKRIGSAFEKRRLEPVRFVPLLQGVVD